MLRRDLWSWSDLGDMDFYFCLRWCCYCFLNNYASYWGLILPLIVVSSCLLCLFCRVSCFSSSLDLNIKTALLIVLISGFFSFFGHTCVGFRSLFLLINLSLKTSFLLLSSSGCFVYFFFCGSVPFSWNHFCNKTFKIMIKWHTSFIGSLLVVLSIMFFWHFSQLFNSLTNWEYVIVAQLTDFPLSVMDIIMVDLLQKYCTLSF